MTDLLAGRIQLISASIGTFQAGLDSGKLRILLTGTRQRLPYLPDTPTAAEAGLPNYLMSVWIAVVAPAGTPQPVLDRIHAMVQAMQKHEPARKALAGAGADIVNMSQPEFAAFVKSDYARWEGIVKAAGVEKE
jgi:tripartite-type tricarboxylate transporter receptor subunit TctC